MNAQTKSDEPHQHSPVLNWSPEDAKLLIITFISTVGANLITVLFVGLAVILARYFRPIHHAVVGYSILVFETSATAMTIYLLTTTVRKSRRERDRSSSDSIMKIAAIISLVFFGGQGLLFALVWTGLAAGIK